MGCETSRPVAPHAGRFSDLVTAPRGCFRIKDTAKRAITLKQMESLVTHTAKRLGCEMEAVEEIQDDKKTGVKIKKIMILFHPEPAVVRPEPVESRFWFA